jgi:hypothetical protein
LAERLGVHSTPTFVLVIGHGPPVSANDRSLATILNSPDVQALFAHEREPGEPPRYNAASQQANPTGRTTSGLNTSRLPSQDSAGFADRGRFLS